MKYIVGIQLEYLGGGIKRKILEQIEVFNKHNFNCDLITLYTPHQKNLKNKIKTRLPFASVNGGWSISNFTNENYIYIRRSFVWDNYAVNFFKKIKSLNPTIKIVYEIPTYPYDAEFEFNFKTWHLPLKDMWHRRRLKKCIDRIATLTDDKKIFGISTLKIGNGLDVNRISPRRIMHTDEIHAIAVANFEWWHGYDRFIDGLKNYYATNPSRKIYFHMVGNGREFERYQRLVASYSLNEYVILYGQQLGKNLDCIYDKCNLGIGGLGGYRKGIELSLELKSREYLAKGLPFVVSTKIMDISDNDKDNIYLKVPNDDSPIDIESVLRFYDKIYSKGTETVNKQLRQYAKENFSMEVAMKEVINFFEEGK